jgi:hypothetical protein
MAKEVFYRQCRLQKKIATGVTEQVSYIPEPFCVLGKVLKLRDEDGNWSDGWKVIFAAQSRRSEEWTNKQSHAHTKNRQASDI